MTETSIELDCLQEGLDFSMKFNRAKFEELNMGSFDKCIKTVEACLSDAKMDKSSVSKVILVGGSTRIPKVQHMLQEFLDGKELCKSVNPDEAIAYGAAVMAAKLSGNNEKRVRDLVLLDVTPLSLGTELLGKVMDVVIPRNTPIPARRTKKFCTTKDNQSEMDIYVYQGERSRSTDNHLLGKFKISGIPCAPKGVQIVQDCYEVDVNGILTVTAEILSTGKTKKLTITNENGRLSKEQIEKMIRDAEEYKDEDEEYKKKANARNALDDCLYNMKNKIKEYIKKRVVSPEILMNMENAIADTTKWIEDNRSASVDELRHKKQYSLEGDLGENVNYLSKVVFEVHGSWLENFWLERFGGSVARLFSLVSLVWYVGMVNGKAIFVVRDSLARETRRLGCLVLLRSYGSMARRFPSLVDRLVRWFEVRVHEIVYFEFFLTEMEGRGNDSPAIGIDLGTTYSCVAVWKDDRVEMVLNDQGNRTTPSCVAFRDGERLVGDAAKNQITTNAANTVFARLHGNGNGYGKQKRNGNGKRQISKIQETETAKKRQMWWFHRDLIEASLDETVAPVSISDGILLTSSPLIISKSFRFHYDVKRLIGRKFGDSKVQHDMKLWPFKVIKGPADTPKIVVSCKGQVKEFFAEGISSMILNKLKEDAEAYLGKPVKDAVITVPAYFNDSQRQATKDAGTIAGLNIIRLINEPTAAAIAYGLDKMPGIVDKMNVVVFDLGGGTFDVSLLTIAKGGAFEVKAVAGDTHLGGEDFDERMVSHCVREFKRRWNKDLTGNQRALGRLRFACEKAKRILSCSTETSIDLDCLQEGIDFSMKFYRATFEELNMVLFNNCMKTLETCLSRAKMDKSCVHKVILVGGSTRIPKVQRMLQEFFDGKELCKWMNLDEAVAHGAALMAAKLSGNHDKRFRDLFLLDVTPLSLGTQIYEGIMDIVIPRNTPIPTKMVKKYKTMWDNQPSMDIEVYQGEKSKCTANHLLGNLVVSGIPCALKGVRQVRVCFEIDANGILTVTAKILSTGKTHKLVVRNENGRLSKEEIKKLAKDVDKYKHEDQECKKKEDARNALSGSLYKMKNKISEYNIKKRVHPEILKVMEKVVADTTGWLENNQDAPVDELQRKKVRLESVCTPTF
ncbi:hypothetical protein OSB04_025052 [Centaurea solstitialis]|uniref:Uncharacterized protein n=1 Tax=Centaurea solstitialis TaxID=347529 RepID=A0AA38WAZ7_9ASTR|nr:hypothetical protein OSB04_025052 [Centaurea solstitialis]